MTDESSPSIDDLLHAKAFEAVIDRLASWSAIKLAEFCIKYPESYDLLKTNELDGFWQARRQAISKYALKAQDGVCDADLTVGHTLYLLTQREKTQGDMKRYQEYLSQALSVHSIHAAQAWIHEIVMAVEKPDLKLIQDIAAILYNQEGLAKRHGTPGYLLVANGYFYLLRWLSEINKDEDLNEWRIQYEGTVFSLWKSLYLAQDRELDSADSIHNAYFGCGLANSNSFKLPTIDAMMDKCGELYGDSALRKRARHAATITGKQGNAFSLWATAEAKSEQSCQQDVLKSHKM